MKQGTIWTELAAKWQQFGEVWVASMLRVCLVGTLILCLALLLNRLLKRTPAGVRCWIWRLAVLKLYLLFFCSLTLGLPILPGASEPNMPAPNTAAIHVQTSMEATAMGTANGTPSVFPPDMATTAETPAEGAPFSAGRAWLMPLIQTLLGVWMVGVGIGLVKLGKQYREALALIRSSCPITDVAIQTELVETTEALGLPRRPELSVSDLTDVPFLFGLLRPSVVLPAAVVADFPTESCRLILAHELAHVKRYDLFWSFLSGFAQVLFFFHPLVGWAHRELRTVQEICCDEQAIRGVDAGVHAYGAVLVQVAASQTSSPQDGLIAVGMAESFTTIQRRLEEMQTFRNHASWRRWMPTVVALVGGVTLLPWQLEAQNNTVSRKPGNGKQAEKGTVKTGDYTLKLVDVNTKQSFRSDSSGGDEGSGFSAHNTSGFSSGGSSGASSASFGPDGKRMEFRSNLTLGLDIAGRNRDDLLLITGVEKLHGQDDQGREVLGPETPTIALPALPSQESAGVRREMLNLHTEEGAKSLKILEGSLKVANATVRTVTFDAPEVKPGASKKVGKITVTIETVRDTGNGYELTVACEAPQYDRPRSAREMMTLMMQGNRGIEAEIIGTNGVAYKSSASGSGSGMGGIFPPLGGLDANPAPEMTTSHQSLAFGQLPEGAQPKSLVFRVAEQQGTSRSLPFKFTDVPLSERR